MLRTNSTQVVVIKIAVPLHSSVMCFSFCFPQQAIATQSCWVSLYGSLAPFKMCLVTDQFKSRQPSTMNRCLLECRKLMRWCNDVKVQFVLPLEPIVVAAYLSQLHRKTGSPSAVSMAYAALVWLQM